MVQVIGIGFLVQFDWYMFIAVYLDSVTMVPSFYLYVRAVGWGKDRWLL
jgi:hypothetical protein